MSDNKEFQPNIVDLGPRGRSGATAEDIAEMMEIRRMGPEELQQKKIIYPGMSQREVLHAFREIRTKLLQLSHNRNFVLMVTSVTSEGGSSFISQNLGAAFALAENKTSLVVDCNIYDPALGDLLAIQPDFGLTDYLQSSDLSIEDIIYASGVPRMRVIPVGQKRESGMEFFTTRRMREFIDGVRARYPDRFIIFDTAPVSVATDAQILAELCDLALLVVPSAKVTESQVMGAVDAIGKEKLAGLVFNNF